MVPEQAIPLILVAVAPIAALVIWALVRHARQIERAYSGFARDMGLAGKGGWLSSFECGGDLDGRRFEITHVVVGYSKHRARVAELRLQGRWLADLRVSPEFQGFGDLWDSGDPKIGDGALDKVLKIDEASASYLRALDEEGRQVLKSFVDAGGRIEGRVVKFRPGVVLEASELQGAYERMRNVCVALESVGDAARQDTGG